MAAVLTSLRDAWGIRTEPMGRTEVRFRVVSDRDRALPNPVMLDLLSPSAVVWMITQIDASTNHVVDLFAFHLAECVWLSDQVACGVTTTVRVQPVDVGYELVAIET